MMLIPPALNLGNTNINASKEKYFTAAGVYANNPLPSTPGSSELSPESSGSRGAYQSPPVDGRMFAPKMQSDFPGFHMHAAAAVVTGHPGSFPLNSPVSYAAGAATAPTHSIVPPHYGSSAIDPASYYSPLGAGYDMKGGDMWNGGYNQPAHAYYQYDTGFGPQYPYDRCYSMDMNDGVRRKNATRESTNTLKAWLQEHKKNPYPTKGEKIMLAIITKMTLTQVSTWFANARRRLKKENKMTWIPKNRANESGSGTEERRQSEDKDSDEKTDDEDCKSDKEDNDQTSDAKPDTDPEANTSCQYNQQNPTSLPCGAHAQNPTETQQDSGPEMTETKPVVEYGRMMGDLSCGSTNMRANANPTLSDKIHNANMVQNPAPMRYESVHDGYNRPIWSPIDSHGQKTLALPPRPYHPSLGTEYHLQTGYPHETEGRRLSSSHSQPYPPNYGIAPPLAHQSMAHNSQEGLALHNHLSTSHIGAKMYSPMSNELVGAKQLNESQEAPELAQADPSRRSEYPYTSPVTNLRNYVNGVFHGPSSQASASGMCDKNLAIPEKSPNPNSDGTVVSPGHAGHYQHPRYDQSFLHHRHALSGENTMSAESYMLHRSLSGPYSSYYNDSAICYQPQSIADSSQQHSSGAYYVHQQSAAPPHLLSAMSAPGDVTHSNGSSTHDGYSTKCQVSPPSVQRGSPEDVNERRRSACMQAYYENTMESSGLPSRSNVPPPPYASQCKFSSDNTQTFLGPQSHPLSLRPTSYDGVDPVESQPVTSHSPRGLQTGTQARDGGGYVCSVSTVTSDDEELHKMQSAEQLSEKGSR